MAFISPIWLFGLLPWAAVSIYLMTGRRSRASVPFLALWSAPAIASKPNRAIHRPPSFIILLILSMLLALLAAAGPMLPSPAANQAHLIIILDRGITMSPASASRHPFRGIIDLATANMPNRFNHASIDFLPVPGKAQALTAADWADAASRMSPTAMDTQSAIQQAFTNCLRSNPSSPIIILTDRHLGIASDRLIQIAPNKPANGIQDVGIVTIAARSQPRPQVMVRLRNQSNRHELVLHVTSGAQQVNKTVALPVAGTMRDYFIDLQHAPADTVQVQIDPHDAALVNDRAWLARQSSWPIVEPRTRLPASVQRMVEVYAKSRAGNSASKHVTVGFGAIPNGLSGLWIQDESAAPAAKDSASTKIIVTPHPITANVSAWPGPADPSASAPDGLAPLVVRNGHVLVAVRDAGTKQAWVNLDLDAWSTTPDFVIFFSNAFDWLGQGAQQEYAADPIALLGQHWKRVDDSPAPAGIENGLWPGLYQRDDGALRAVNAPDVIWRKPPHTDWQHKLARQHITGAGEIPFAPWLCAAAVIAALLAVCFIPTKTRT